MTEPLQYRVSHRTTYQYAKPMADGYTRAYLLPRPTVLQVVERAEVDVDPVPDERAEHIDVFGNRVLQLGVHHGHDHLTLHAESVVVVEPQTLPDDGPTCGATRDAVAARRGGEARSTSLCRLGNSAAFAYRQPSSGDSQHCDHAGDRA